MKCKILVIGAGAIGVYFSGRLAQAGAEVTVVARGDFEVASKSGYRVESINGNFDWRPRVIRSADEYDGVADLILIAAKALPGVDITAMVAPAVGKESAFLIIQNGLDVECALHQAYPANELISAIAFIGVSRIASGVISHKGGGELTIGRYATGGKSAMIEKLINGFAEVGVKCHFAENTEQMRWNKLLWNIPFNPLSVLSGGMNTRQMMEDADIYALAYELMREVQLISAAYGCVITDEAIERNMEYTRNFPPYKTSMLLDYESQRQLEVDAILGSVVRRAAAKNISIPRISSIHALLSAIDKMNRVS